MGNTEFTKRKKKTKPALWLSAFPSQAIKAAHDDKQTGTNNSRRFKFKRRRDFSPTVRKRKQQKARERAAYNARVREWLKEPGHQFCWVMIARMRNGEDVDQLSATQCHHKHGRGTARNSLLMDERFWIPVSAVGHAWIDANRDKARALGLLAPIGQWNSLPK